MGVTAEDLPAAAGVFDITGTAAVA